MKKASLLLLCGAFLYCACQNQQPEVPSADADLTGTKVDLSGVVTSAKKVFLLNEGGMGSNNASLDFLRISDASYITSAFKKMNPEAAAGLGDTGNDIAVYGDEVWMVINNSGLVEVVSAKDEKELAAIKVATPRSIAFDDKYAYVTSWAGAYAIYGPDYSITDFKNPKGMLYRIDLKTRKLDSKAVEVGYQPEGVAVHDGKIYVANSGGIASSLPPAYAYDNTVSVIDAASFTLEKNIEVAVNLKNVYADGKGNIYVTTLGNFYDVHSGLYRILAGGSVAKVADYVSISALKGDTLWFVGNAEEFDFSATQRTWKAFRCKDGVLAEVNLPVGSLTAPYGLCALSDNAFLVSDAGDYWNPGSVSLFLDGAKKWTVTAGVCPGHFALW